MHSSPPNGYLSANAITTLKNLLAGGVEKKARTQITQQTSFQHIVKCLIKQAQTWQGATTEFQSQKMHKLLQAYSIDQLLRIWEVCANTLLSNDCHFFSLCISTLLHSYPPRLHGGI